MDSPNITFPGEWFNSPEAEDLDGNGNIDIFDLFIWAENVPPSDGEPPMDPEPPDVETWLNGPDAADLSGDGITNDIDFYFFDAQAWFGSPEGFDFNDDGAIDFADYFVWVDENSEAPPPAPEPETAPDFETWRNGPEAVDQTGEGSIDETDYYLTFPGEWFNSPEAEDLDGNGNIDFFDLFIWAENVPDGGPVDPSPDEDPPLDPSPPDVETWLNGPEAADLSGEGVVDEIDYYFAFPETWFDSPLASDLNDDGSTDFNDYLSWVSAHSGGEPAGPPVSLDEWLNGPGAEDLNGDGVTNEIDFYLFDPQAWFDGDEGFDFNGDGTIDFGDYIVWVEENSAAPPPDGPFDEPPELTALFNLHQQFLNDPNLELIFIDELVDLEPFVRDILFDFSGGTGELSLEDVENAIAAFDQAPPATFELQLLFGLLAQLDEDPNLEFILVDDLTALEEGERQFLRDAALGDGELTRQDIEAAISLFDGGDPVPADPPELVLLRNLNEEFILDPGLEIIFVDALDIPAFERDFLLSLAPGGELTRNIVAEALAQFEGPPIDPEMELVFALLEEFDIDPNLEVLFVDELTHLDDFQRNFLMEIGGGTGEVRRADLEAFIGQPGPGPVDEPPELVLLRQLNEEFVLDPGLQVIFIDALDIPDFERDFLLSLAPDGELTRERVAEELALLEGPPIGPELDFLFSLIEEFDNDPELVFFAGDSRFDEFQQGILFQFADDFGDFRREDLDRAIEEFGGGGGGLPPELELLFLLLSDFDIDPSLEFIPVAVLVEQFDPSTIDFLEDVAQFDGELSRADLEEAIANLEGGVTPPDGEPFDVILLRSLNEEFARDPDLDVLFVDALDLPQNEIDFLLSIAPDGVLTRDLVADVLAQFEGPPPLGPELDFFFELLILYDENPELVLTVLDPRFDEFQQNLVSQFANDAGELRREDVERALEVFGGGGEPPLPPELELLFLLLSDFDIDPSLEFIPVAVLVEQFDPSTIDFLEDVAQFDGELSRADLEEAIANLEGGVTPPDGEPPIPPELDLILALLEEFDLNPELEFIPVDDRFDDFQLDFLNAISGDSGFVTRPDLEAALADIDGDEFPNIEEAAGRIAVIDLATGIVRLQGVAVGITDGTVFIDGPSGEPIDPTSLEPGNPIVVHAVWDQEGRAFALEVILDGEIPPHSNVLWLQFGEFGTAPNGQQVLRELTGEYQLTDRTVAFFGPDFADFDPAGLQAGDYVVMQTQGSEVGFEVLEIHVGAGEEPLTFRNIVLPLFDLDPVLSEVRFEADPINLSTFTQFFGPDGGSISASDLAFGDVILVELDLEGEALAVRLLDPDEPVPFPDNPDIIAFETAFAGVDADVITAFRAIHLTGLTTMCCGGVVNKLEVDRPMLTSQSIDSDIMGRLISTLIVGGC